MVNRGRKRMYRLDKEDNDGMKNKHRFVSILSIALCLVSNYKNMMFKSIIYIIFSVSLMSNCFSQKHEQILLKINSVENSLIKDIQIKGGISQKMNLIERMDFYKVPGLSIAIVENGKIRWAKGYGYANTKSGKKVDTNTLFQAGSISKPLAALSALKLYENDSLDLNKDVNYYLENWQIYENEFTENEKVTVEKLLTHTAGISVSGFPGYKQTDDFPHIINVLNGKGNTGKILVDTIPESIWRYSGGGYTVMQKVVEDISGVALNDYMSNNIFLPIGMRNSTLQQPKKKEFQNNISAAYDAHGKLIQGL